ncbi:SDR family oxidoreductase [Streptomyces stramineus]
MCHCPPVLPYRRAPPRVARADEERRGVAEGADGSADRRQRAGRGPVLRALAAAGYGVVALVHRTDAPGASATVEGDVCRPSLGLPPGQYRELARLVDVVVHCAAATAFRPDAHRTMAVNTHGTERVLAFASHAQARLIHLSSAFVTRAELVRRNIAAYAGAGAEPIYTYLDSKQRAERQVRDAHVPHVIVRPSLVIGDSQTGRMDCLQGVPTLLVAALAGWLKWLPLAPETTVDVVPSDFLARAIVELAADASSSGTVWVTAGSAAPTMGRLVRLLGSGNARRTGQSAGLDLLDPVSSLQRLERWAAGAWDRCA